MGTGPDGGSAGRSPSLHDLCVASSRQGPWHGSGLHIPSRRCDSCFVTLDPEWTPYQTICFSVEIHAVSRKHLGNHDN